MEPRPIDISEGGFDSRFLLATKSQPKEMLPVVDKPTIQYIVEEAVASGIEDGDKIADNLYTVKNLVEKPKPEVAPSNVAIMGRYIITPQIFDILEHTAPGAGGEIQLTDALKTLATREKMLAYTFQGRRHDVGDKLGFLQATVEFALQRDNLHDDFLNYLEGIVKSEREKGK